MNRRIRIESGDFAWLCTSRTVNSKLWLVNNPKLELFILGYLALYLEKYQVTLYGFVIQGNHYHLLVRFTRANRAAFLRDFNARFAEGVRLFVDEFEGGPLWERRYSAEIVPNHEDIEDRFFYCALQAVRSGLTERISDYPGYNSFGHATSGIVAQYPVVDYSRYNEAKKRYAQGKLTTRPRKSDFTKYYELKFARLPGYEELSQKEYKELMLQKLEERRMAIRKQRQEEGKPEVPAPSALRKVKPGASPQSTKKTRQGGFRPLVLTLCAETRRRITSWYFAVMKAYKAASLKYRQGVWDVPFPEGTYKPPGCTICALTMAQCVLR